MKTQLGTFEGRPIDVGALKLTGSASERVGKLDMGEEVYVICRAIVGRIEHGKSKDGFVRVHKADAVAMALIERDDGERMLSEGQALADERFGLAGLFGGRAEFTNENEDASTTHMTYDAKTGEITVDEEEGE